MAEHRFASYEEFLPFYVAQHSRPLTRWLHLVGTLSGVAVAATGLVSGRRHWLAAIPLLGYGLAWPAHWLVERNRPATFDHALWSLRGDAAMIFAMLRGRDAELSATAAAWLEAHPEDGSAGSLALPWHPDAEAA